MRTLDKLLPPAILLSVGFAFSWPTAASAATCTIAPADPVVAQNGSVGWSAAKLEGFSGTPTYAWTFTGGNIGSSTAAKPTVTYSRVGGFTTRLTVRSGTTSATCGTTVTVAPKVSINSTSQSSSETVGDPYAGTRVPEAPRPRNANSLNPVSGTGNLGHQVLAINDLGMHCGDLDTRVASILPPFQVLLSQVIRKGSEPRILGPNEAQVVYSAASNPSDPILSTPFDPKTGYPFTGLVTAANGSVDVFKTNFWDIAFKAYDPFYPPGVLAKFYDPNDPTKNRDIGLPVPNVEDLYIGPDGLVDRPRVSSDGFLSAVQHAMPGIANPYVRNDVQIAKEHYEHKPFFVNFPFGYVADDVNWFEGAGVPFAAFDDYGRQNPYPLVRVQAKSSGGAVLATVDTVLPISGEANCQGCHAATVDGGNGAGIKSLAPMVVKTSIDDPAHGRVPDAVSVEWASDLNILKLHDQKHRTTLLSSYDSNGRAAQPVVCQRCHYTPALDLAQVGPQDVNGRQQTSHKSMSNVMHSHHATMTDGNNNPLFVDMPAPAADSATTGLPANQADREANLAQTCYQCHPGNKTKCMRGAMADGGMVCQDCHGQMAQVGDDFSRKVTSGGGFTLAKDFYTNPATPRVPWANEPGCGSCHTGDATSNLAASLGTLKNGYDSDGNVDNIRLIRAYRSNDAKATPIIPANKRFAENTIPASFNGFPNPGAGNPKLYRVSTGHGGVMCEGCHGATHAEWDSDGSPLTNDNVTANQLQGHSGTVMECNTCHVTSNLSADTQEGPHGMHLVNDHRFWDDEHGDLAEDENRKADGGTCAACHGRDHKGTVLSRTPVTRTFTVEGSTRTVLAGDPVGCGHCHSLDKSFER